MREVPLNRWGRVLASSTLHAEQVRVEAPGGGAFLVLLRKAGSEFDQWCSSMTEVELVLGELRIEWNDADAPAR